MKSIKSFVSSIIWFQSRVFSSICLEVMKGQRWSKNCWILPFSHLDYGQTKVAMAFRQCPMNVRDPPGPLGAPSVPGDSQKLPNHQIFLSPPFKWANPSFPLVKSYHTPHWVIHWKPLGNLRGPWESLRAWKRQKNTSNCQIFCCPPFKWVTPCFPIVKSPYSKILCLKFSWHTMVSIGDPWGPLGAPQSTKVAKKCFQSSDIPFDPLSGE